MPNRRPLSIPSAWPQSVRSAIVDIASLAHTAVIYTGSWCANSQLARVRLAGKLEEAQQEIALLREELRIKDARMQKIPPLNRPHYPPTERLAIIERFIRSLKHEHTRRILVPLRAVEFRTALSWYVEWYNGQRPHQSLDGKTPDDVYSGAARDSPAFVVRGADAVKLDLHVSPHRGQTHLPIVELRKVA